MKSWKLKKGLQSQREDEHEDLEVQHLTGVIKFCSGAYPEGAMVGLPHPPNAGKHVAHVLGICTLDLSHLPVGVSTQTVKFSLVFHLFSSLSSITFYKSGREPV